METLAAGLTVWGVLLLLIGIWCRLQGWRARRRALQPHTCQPYPAAAAPGAGPEGPVTLVLVACRQCEAVRAEWRPGWWVVGRLGGLVPVQGDLSNDPLEQWWKGGIDGA